MCVCVCGPPIHVQRVKVERKWVPIHLNCWQRKPRPLRSLRTTSGQRLRHPPISLESASIRLETRVSPLELPNQGFPEIGWNHRVDSSVDSVINFPGNQVDSRGFRLFQGTGGRVTPKKDEIPPHPSMAYRCWWGSIATWSSSGHVLTVFGDHPGCLTPPTSCLLCFQVARRMCFRSHSPSSVISRPSNVV